ncbi:hypothetical protein RclHR1_13000004 [Rhizophagus clarus]|nr:hypothetical protein RclHR1_13000004 [Rhizophagus clarus]
MLESIETHVLQQNKDLKYNQRKMINNILKRQLEIVLGRLIYEEQETFSMVFTTDTNIIEEESIFQTSGFNTYYESIDQIPEFYRTKTASDYLKSSTITNYFMIEELNNI